MKPALILTAALVSSALAFPTASADMTLICTFPTLPVGACVEVLVTSTTLSHPTAQVGPGYTYVCDPFALVCVLAPEVTTGRGSQTIPWVSLGGTYVWCSTCEGSDVVELLA